MRLSSPTPTLTPTAAPVVPDEDGQQDQVRARVSLHLGRVASAVL